MNIADLLIESTAAATDNHHHHQEVSCQQHDSNKYDSNRINSSNNKLRQPVYDEHLMRLWERVLEDSGFHYKPNTERSNLTDGYIWPSAQLYSAPFLTHTPIHIKVIGRHMNGSFRCHIGTGKASRPMQSIEICQQMRLLAVFFRAEKNKSQLVSPEFIFFPTWLLHLFRYTEHGSTPGRTDVRFLENASLAKEDHIYRLNNILNTMFRFNLHDFDKRRLQQVVELANFLFDVAGFSHHDLPRPGSTATQPQSYTDLVELLQAPRPTKLKPMCSNCNTKTASRRRLCVACYRYQLKHNQPRPLRLIVANRPGPRVVDQRNLPMVFYSPPPRHHHHHHQQASSTSAIQQPQRKRCANCGVHETHQWYRNLCGVGHWCETCKSYYLRHTRVRPPELFVKAAKRKVDIRTLVNWLSTPTPMSDSQQNRRPSSSGTSSECSSPTADSIASCPTTPPQVSFTTYTPSLCFPSSSLPTPTPPPSVASAWRKQPAYYSL